VAITITDKLQPGELPIYIAEPGFHIIGGSATPTPDGGFDVTVAVAKGKSSSKRVDIRKL